MLRTDVEKWPKVIGSADYANGVRVRIEQTKAGAFIVYNAISNDVISHTKVESRAWDTVRHMGRMSQATNNTTGWRE